MATGTPQSGSARLTPAVPERRPTMVERLAQFVCCAQFEEISEAAREQLKLRVLDSLGCALGALAASRSGWSVSRCRSSAGLRSAR
jgi:hypothetical protein